MALEKIIEPSIFFHFETRELAEQYLKAYFHKHYKGSSVTQKKKFSEAMVARGLRLYDDYQNGVVPSRRALNEEKNPGYQSIQKYFSNLLIYMNKKLKADELLNPPIKARPIVFNPAIKLKGAELFSLKKKADAANYVTTYLNQPYLNGIRSESFQGVKPKLLEIALHIWVTQKEGGLVTTRGLARDFSISRAAVYKHFGDLIREEYYSNKSTNELVIKTNSNSEVKLTRELLQSTISYMDALTLINSEIKNRICLDNSNVISFSNKIRGMLIALWWDLQNDQTEISEFWYLKKFDLVKHSFRAYFPETFPITSHDPSFVPQKRERGKRFLLEAIKLATVKNQKPPLACACCNLTSWKGNPIQVWGEIDHIDGNRNHNNPNNKRILCANCHQLAITKFPARVLQTTEELDPGKTNLLLTKDAQETNFKRLFAIFEKYKNNPSFYYSEIKRKNETNKGGGSLLGQEISVGGIAAGVRPMACEKCGITSWLDAHVLPILTAHHKNHISTDNRIENIATLCANCHKTEHWEAGILSEEFQERLEVSYWLGETSHKITDVYPDYDFDFDE